MGNEASFLPLPSDIAQDVPEQALIEEVLQGPHIMGASARARRKRGSKCIPNIRDLSIKEMQQMVHELETKLSQKRAGAFTSRRSFLLPDNEAEATAERGARGQSPTRRPLCDCTSLDGSDLSCYNCNDGPMVPLEVEVFHSKASPSLKKVTVGTERNSHFRSSKHASRMPRSRSPCPKAA